MLGAKEAGNQVEKIYIQDKKINFCFGCLACQNNGGSCVQHDDMEEIMEKMIESDVLVLVTPVYFEAMNATLAGIRGFLSCLSRGRYNLTYNLFSAILFLQVTPLMK